MLSVIMVNIIMLSFVMLDVDIICLLELEHRVEVLAA
jgi:hypothetical protein